MNQCLHAWCLRCVRCTCRQNIKFAGINERTHSASDAISVCLRNEYSDQTGEEGVLCRDFVRRLSTSTIGNTHTNTKSDRRSFIVRVFVVYKVCFGLIRSVAKSRAHQHIHQAKAHIQLQILVCKHSPPNIRCQHSFFFTFFLHFIRPVLHGRCNVQTHLYRSLNFFSLPHPHYRLKSSPLAYHFANATRCSTVDEKKITSRYLSRKFATKIIAVSQIIRCKIQIFR